MDILISFVQEYNWIFTIAITVLLVILILMQILNRVEYNRLEKRYKKMMRGTTGKTIEDLVSEYTAKIEGTLDDVKKLDEECRSINTRLKSCVQKVSITRYKAFDDVGSDLSFSIAMLDESNDGFVITGIYGRNDSTMYAKPVEKGISKYDLSDEEKQVLREALGQK